MSGRFDLAAETLPRAWVISVPLLAYRLAMLAWALWLAQVLLGVPALRWAPARLRIFSQVERAEQSPRGVPGGGVRHA
jgi:hypothetical protein